MFTADRCPAWCTCDHHHNRPKGRHVDTDREVDAPPFGLDGWAWELLNPTPTYPLHKA